MITLFDGQVCIEVRLRTLRALVIEDLLRAAVPEIAGLPRESQSQTVLDNLATFLSQTAITFHLPESNPHPTAAALKTFWDFAQSSTDYRAIWTQYLELLSLEAHNAWIGAVNEARRSDYQAPEDIQPGADEPQDPLDEQPETATSKRLTEMYERSLKTKPRAKS